MDISSMLGGLINDEQVKQISGQLGESESATKGAIGAAVPMIMKAMSNKAQGGGISDIMGMMGQADNEGVLGNITQLLGPGENSSLGGNIISSLLGGKTNALADGISKNSGMTLGSVTKLLPLLAPIVMGYLSKKKSDDGVGESGITDLIGGVLNQSGGNSGAMGMLGGLLDADGDGDIKDDLLDKGKDLLGGFFK